MILKKVITLNISIFCSVAIIVLFSLIQFNIHSQTVETVVGIQGLTGKIDGDISVATFNNPHGVEVDHLGNIFVADRYNHLIRKIDVNGIVTTIAGSGISGSNDGQGTAASFNEPWALTLDTLGNIYVADTKNNKIRKISTTGYVSTLAGAGSFGIKDSPNPLIATFGNPTGIAIDKDGNLFIGDHLTHLIRKIDTNGEVTTFAGDRNYPNSDGFVDGNGQAAKFNRPYGIEIDKYGNLYVADEWNHAIRKISPNADVTTLGGNGTPGAVNGSKTVSSFKYPWDVAVDDLGNVFVADGLNYVIRKINTNNITSTFAGIIGVSGGNNGVVQNATFNGATSLSFNKGKTELVVGDAYNQLIRRIFYENILVPTVSFTNYNSDTVQICQNSSVSISVSGNFTSYEVYIDNLLSATLTSSSSSIHFSDFGVHTVYFKGIKAGYYPTSSNELIVEVVQGNTFDLIIGSSNDLCEGDSARIQISDLTVVTWNTGEVSNEIYVSNTGEYYVTAIAGECLSKRDTVRFNFHPYPVPQIIASSDGPYYFGDSIYVSVLGGASYLWSNQSTQNQIIVDTSGVFSVVLDNGYGCTTNSDTLTFVFEERPIILSIAVPNGNVICRGDSLEIIANETSSIQWYFNGEILQGEINDTLIVRNEGNYSFSYTTPFDSTVFSPQKEIFINEVPEFDITEEILNTSITSVKAYFTPSYLDGILYEWYIDSVAVSEGMNLDYAFLSDGIYEISLTISSIEGCENSKAKDVEIILDEPLFVPTGFSPNFDGLNDVVFVRGVSSNATINFMIFNEWGQLVFSTTKIEEGWDGSFNGQEANIGNYSYILQVTKYNITKSIDGIITLIR